VTGLAHIQLDDDSKSSQPLKPGPSGLPRLPMKSSPLNMLADQGPVLLERVDEISRRLNAMLGEDNQKRVSVALDNIAAASGGIKDLAETMNKTAKDFPQITADAHQTLQSLTKAGNAATGVATDLQQTVRKVNAPTARCSRLPRARRPCRRRPSRWGAAPAAHERRGRRCLARRAQHGRGCGPLQ
jgi:phospholipid/cholesterol/gamma-HCH transport system substrate-binding protein